MKLSVCLTLNDRPIPVLEQVFDSLGRQSHDELVIALDRTPVVLADWILEYWKEDSRVVYANLDGRAGWQSPVKAWNSAFKAASGDVLYCFSSDTVQAELNVQRAMGLLTQCVAQVSPGSVIHAPEITSLCLHGRCECSCGSQGQEVNWNGQAPGNLFSDAAHPRPLGFIWAAPAWAVKQTGGFDEGFSAGYWYDDNDFFLRLWRTGVDFVFDDSISGIHLHHERPALSTPEGQEGIQRNESYMLYKHGLLHPWEQLPKIVEKRPGRTTWKHLWT